MRTYSTMKDAAEAYAAYRSKLGYIDTSVSSYCRSFAEFADRNAFGEAMTGELVMRWAKTGKNALARARLLRFFAVWLKIHDPRTNLPAYLLECHPPSKRKRPYIFTHEELAAIMSEALRHPWRKGTQPPLLTYQTVIGLLAATGMRSGEAIRLDNTDVDLDNAVLCVRKSKNMPMRLVPIHETTADALRKYREHRDHKHPHSATDAFFLTTKGLRLPHDTIIDRFGIIQERAGVPFRNHWRRPRLTDLRHTFACRHLQYHYERDKDLSCAIADLAVYLGHAAIEYTYWYLTGVPEILGECAERFSLHIGQQRREGMQ